MRLEMSDWYWLTAGLAAGEAEPQTVMIDATYLKAHRRALGLRLNKGDPGRLIGRTKGGMNTKLHAITDQNGRPLSFFMAAGQISDFYPCRCSAGQPAHGTMDTDWFRDALEEKGIKPCIQDRNLA